MKIKGRSVKAINERVVVLERQNGENLVFKFHPVEDTELFDKVYPDVQAPVGMRPGGQAEPDRTDETYLQEVHKRNTAMNTFMFISSISATEGLEFETVKLDDPSTYANVYTELRDAGVTRFEINALMAACVEVHGLNEEAIRRASERFLLSVSQGQAAQK